MENKDLDKRVRALTILSKDHEIVDLAARYFDSKHPLHAVCLLSLFTFFYLIIICFVTLGLFSFQDHQSLVSRPPFPEGGAIQDVPVSAASEAPEAEDSQDGDEGEDSLEGTSSTTSPPPALSEDLGIDKKRKGVKELASSSVSARRTVTGETLALEDELELFDALDS
jgi:hypothetical protein